MARNSSPVAFVLSGGAGLGAIQVGMLRALYERGIEPDLIVATSAGAVNGAFIATRAPSVETADDLGSIWRRVRQAIWEREFPPRVGPLPTWRAPAASRQRRARPCPSLGHERS